MPDEAKPTDAEREMHIRDQVAGLTEEERQEGFTFVDLDDWRFLLRLLDEARVEAVEAELRAQNAERDFDHACDAAVRDGEQRGYEAAKREMGSAW